MDRVVWYAFALYRHLLKELDFVKIAPQVDHVQKKKLQLN